MQERSTCHKGDHHHHKVFGMHQSVHNCCASSVAGGPRTASLHYLLLQTWLAEEPGRARGQRLVEVREGDRLPPAQVTASCEEGEEM